MSSKSYYPKKPLWVREPSPSTLLDTSSPTGPTRVKPLPLYTGSKLFDDLAKNPILFDTAPKPKRYPVQRYVPRGTPIVDSGWRNAPPLSKLLSDSRKAGTNISVDLQAWGRANRRINPTTLLKFKRLLNPLDVAQMALAAVVAPPVLQDSSALQDRVEIFAHRWWVRPDNISGYNRLVFYPTQVTCAASHSGGLQPWQIAFAFSPGNGAKLSRDPRSPCSIIPSAFSVQYARSRGDAGTYHFFPAANNREPGLPSRAELHVSDPYSSPLLIRARSSRPVTEVDIPLLPGIQVDVVVPPYVTIPTPSPSPIGIDIPPGGPPRIVSGPAAPYGPPGPRVKEGKTRAQQVMFALLKQAYRLTELDDWMGVAQDIADMHADAYARSVGVPRGSEAYWDIWLQFFVDAIYAIAREYFTDLVVGKYLSPKIQRRLGGMATGIKLNMIQ